MDAGHLMGFPSCVHNNYHRYQHSHPLLPCNLLLHHKPMSLVYIGFPLLDMEIHPSCRACDLKSWSYNT